MIGRWVVIGRGGTQEGGRRRAGGLDRWSWRARIYRSATYPAGSFTRFGASISAGRTLSYRSISIISAITRYGCRRACDRSSTKRKDISLAQRTRGFYGLAFDVLAIAGPGRKFFVRVEVARAAWENPKKRRELHRRVLEGMREAGILLMVFGPLDIAVGKEGTVRRWAGLVIFIVSGFILFAMGALGELGVEDDDDA